MRGCINPPGRRLSATVTLHPLPDDEPLVLSPYLGAPGLESPFLLTLMLDDVDDDGDADVTLRPIGPPPDDWHVKRVEGSWGACAATPDDPAAFRNNTRVRFSLSGGGASAKVYARVSTIGVNHDARAHDGMQTGGTGYPSIGMVLLPPSAADADADADAPIPPEAIRAKAVSADGVWLEATLPVGAESHVLVPYIDAAHEGEKELRYAVTLFSDAPMGEVVAAAAGAAGEFVCELYGDKCPFKGVVERIEGMERVMDERLAFLDAVLASNGGPVSEM